MVRTNPLTASFRGQRNIIPRIAKYHSADSEGSFRGSSTTIPRIAAQKLCEFRADFVKFLVTSTVCISYTTLESGIN